MRPFSNSDRTLFRDSRLILTAAGVLVAFTSALTAHGVIELSSGADEATPGHMTAYALREHAAVVPLAATGVALLAVIVLWIACRAVSRRDESGPALRRLSSEFRALNRARCYAAMFAAAVVTLVSMEFAEQVLTTGHVEGIADALGGNIGIGLAIVAGVTAAVTAAGFAFAGVAVTATVTTAIRVAGWLVVIARSLFAVLRIAQCIVGRSRHVRPPRTGIQVLVSHGLRSPPYASF